VEIASASSGLGERSIWGGGGRARSSIGFFPRKKIQKGQMKIQGKGESDLGLVSEFLLRKRKSHRKARSEEHETTTRGRERGGGKEGGHRVQLGICSLICVNSSN